MREHLTLAERVDLNEAVAHVIQSLQPIAAQAGTTIEFRRLEEPAVIRGDSDEIVQVFQNLVQNAIKYGKPGGRIDVAIGASRPAAGARPLRRLGDGRRARHRSPAPASPHRALLPRQRVASREKGGTGLGLAIVKHILNRHRGELNITSRVGHGRLLP